MLFICKLYYSQFRGKSKTSIVINRVVNEFCKKKMEFQEIFSNLGFHIVEEPCDARPQHYPRWPHVQKYDNPLTPSPLIPPTPFPLLPSLLPIL